MSSDYSRIERAIHFLYMNVDSQPSLGELAKFLNLSEFHCHRLFKKWAGVTPKDFLQFVTLAKSKSLLRKSYNLLDTSLEVGLSSTSRLHDLYVNLESVTPGEYKNAGEGLEIYWCVFDSIFGRVGIAATERGLCSLEFVSNEAKYYHSLKEIWPHASLNKNRNKLKSLESEISARFIGKKKTKINLHVTGTNFQLKVWEALLRIPEGEFVTYQAIADYIHAPTSSRAVGSAVGSNPIGYLIPCHRVIKSTGAIGEYHWGVERKTQILGCEFSRARKPSTILTDD